ncbi:biofilm/acid-resistance regulator YmgB/AriR [Tatumella saanichensis]|uniref:biofilm/acid-resistance regulator YmgB/AriR n=1 Tax=Tatumella saanichensis TaxID=480813 RepID=UPI0004AEA10A|nr:biofilm/acid-resistance regulator YmgB/AriR [Tatumella saanichensis]
MQQTTTPEADIVHYFHSSTDDPSAETAVLSAIVNDIVLSGRKATNKAIILYLIAELENTSDPMQLDILRNALEMVVSKTPDDQHI